MQTVQKAQGQIILRYAGKLRHLNICRDHRGASVLAPVHDRETMIIDLAIGTTIAEHLIDSDRDYQPKKHERCPDTS
ncbi:hypothetical protein [Nesterenkonia ebinurensis]|uniref:hypothetical protein n=1 Tax=Nesterenkonia ebinurensis TaxID=2608252 RepID=UPI00123D945E|nr:hypothetical protein [Nesterenkonia ebinurensis]